ncbi:hypothetical protein C8R46DRAFT_1113816 [Mycena filopes]|nr:hypothetical protein C8R46DRAFT_1113816 [Mycena filopes]
MLETLIVSYRPLDDAEPPQKLFSAAPRLHRLIFIEDAKPAMFILPQALSKVTCERSITAEELLNLLRDAPFLQQLSCDISDHVSSRTWETTPHDCLETLDSNLHPVLKCLRLPALQTLHLSDGQEATAGYFPAFISSSTHLRHFSATSIRPMSVAWFATAMPGLESIDLCDPPQPFLSQFFARLDRTKDSRFLPHLRALVFREGSLRLPRSRRSHPDAQRATIPLFLDPSSSSGLTGKSLPSMILIQTGPGILLGAIPGS